MKMKSFVPKKEKIDFGMCRICDEEMGKIPIFNSVTHPNIPEEIHTIAGVIISETDNLPKHMCQSCLDLLNGCIMFRDLCQRTNKKMIELSIKKENSPDPDSGNDQKEPMNSDDSYNIPSPTFSDDLEIQTCLLCNQEFYDRQSYKRHISVCKKERKLHKVSIDPNNKSKSFLCDICGKTARSNANLLVHMGTHENIFPFKCEQCPYQGRTMDLLKVHKRSHLADKPYKCTQCPKATTTASNLAKHMRHVHSTNRPFKCNYCEKAFSYQHDMKRHIKDIHLRQGTVECDICCKKFNTKKILQGHRWKIHKIKGERQGRLPMYLQFQNDESE